MNKTESLDKLGMAVDELCCQKPPEVLSINDVHAVFSDIIEKPSKLIKLWFEAKSAALKFRL